MKMNKIDLDNNKKQWEKPELIILTHSNEDEVLELDCKLKVNSLGPTSANNKCDQPMNPQNPCGACQAQTSGS